MGNRPDKSFHLLFIIPDELSIDFIKNALETRHVRKERCMSTTKANYLCGKSAQRLGMAWSRYVSERTKEEQW